MAWMRRSLWMALVAAVAVPAVAGFTEALDPVEDVVEARLLVVDRATKDGRRQFRALRSAQRTLGGKTKSLGTDLAALKKCSKRLGRALPDDVELSESLDDAFLDLRTATLSDRERLAGAVEGLSPRAQDRARKALDQFDAKLSSADDEERLDRAAAKLKAGWNKLRRGEKQAGLGPKPKFRLPDVNASSTRFGEKISPRDHLTDVSAWYFGHST